MNAGLINRIARRTISRGTTATQGGTQIRRRERIPIRDILPRTIRLHPRIPDQADHLVQAIQVLRPTLDKVTLPAHHLHPATRAALIPDPAIRVARLQAPGIRVEVDTRDPARVQATQEDIQARVRRAAIPVRALQVRAPAVTAVVEVAAVDKAAAARQVTAVAISEC